MLELPKPLSARRSRSMGGRESWLNHNSCRWIHQPVADYTSELVAKMVCMSRGYWAEVFCRPISRVLYPSRKGRTVTIYLAQPPAVKPAEVRLWRSDVTVAVKQPTRGRAGHLCPPIWPCSRWGLAAAASPQAAGRSYRPISPLSRFRSSGPASGRYVSVPLSVPDFSLSDLHRDLGVTQHPAQRSPDFPPSFHRWKNGGHPVCIALRFEL